MSSGTRVVLALIAGLAIGAALAAFDSPVLGAGAIAVLEPVGVLWLNALRMTVVPLVVALLVTGVASAAEAARTGRTALHTLVYFLVFLTIAAVLAALLLPLALDVWPVAPDAAAALRASLGATAAVPPPLPVSEWLAQLVPTNPIAAAAEGAMLPLMVFALLFGFAASRVDPVRRAPLLGFFQAVVDTMLVLVGWILFVAPLGVFALALGVGFRSGAGAVGVLGYYVVLMSGLCVLLTLLLYPVAVLFGHVSLLRFSKAAAPAQVVAVSTQSSLASLPAMLTAAQAELGIAQRVSGLVLPLAVSLFRITSPPVNLAIVLFVAHVYGMDLGATPLLTGLVVAIVTSFAVVSLPSQITFFTTTVPISLAMGVPTELLSLLIAIEVIPDIFRTLGNVTADLTVTAVVARHSDG